LCYVILSLTKVTIRGNIALRTKTHIKLRVYFPTGNYGN